MYKSEYKKGSYGSTRKPLSLKQSSVLAAQQRAKYNKVLASLGRAPLANRGFSSMSIPQNRERKFFDILTATYQANTTGSFTLLHIPQLGSDFNNRIGRKTHIRSIYIRGRILIEPANAVPATTAGNQQARLIVFIDLQPNGAAPAVTDLLNEAVPSSHLNPNNRDRFKVIKDKTFVFEPFTFSTTATQSVAAWNRTIHDIKIYKKCNIETIFNATNGGTIGDINSGAVYMFWIGSTVAGALDANAILSARVRFDDS